MNGERYTLIRKVGSGGMAEVWKARAHGAAGFRKTVAIKQVLGQFAKDPEFISRFISEAQVVAELVHPNIVQVFDFGELEPGVYFLAMEYVAGTDLQTLSSRVRADGGKLPPEIVIYAGIETAKALGYASSRTPPIIHRDISPQNLLVSYDGEVKVTDFGIAKVVGSSTVAGTLKGKLGYISPEQAHGRKVDHRSDLFSLGVTLFRLLCGEEMFPGKTLPERYSAIARFDDTTCAKQLEAVPGEVRPILMRALRVNPDDRYSDAAEMEADLVRCLDMASTIPTRQALGKLVHRYCPEEDETERNPSEAENGTSPTVFTGPERKPAPAVSPATLPPGQPRPSSSSKKPPGSAGRRTLLMIAIFVGLTVLFTAAAMGIQQFWLASGRPTPTQVAQNTPVQPTSARTLDPSPETTMTSDTEVSTPSPEPSEPAPERSATKLETPTAAPTRRVVRTAARTPTPTPKPTKIARKIPNHPLSLLDGCTEQQLRTVSDRIRAAIREGAPAYNRGDIASCFRIYEATAVNLQEALPDGCPGPSKALAAGLERARAQSTPREQAWAMRDTFDGLLRVIARKVQE